MIVHVRLCYIKGYTTVDAGMEDPDFDPVREKDSQWSLYTTQLRDWSAGLMACDRALEATASSLGDSPWSVGRLC